MKTIFTLLASVVGAGLALGGDKTPPVTAAAPEAPYEAGRGLITLEGPSGLFINPTSATLPAGAFTGQYCFFLPENDSDPWGHGLMLAYGVTDWLEVGAIGNYVDVSGDPIGGGPLARIRLTKDEGWVPQISIGGYSVFGDDPVARYGAFGAFYKRIPIDENGFVKSIGIHGGLRKTWHDGAFEDVFNVYGGLEIQLPARFYLVGEVSTRDDDAQKEVPYAFGIQWRAGGINVSVAGIQDGTLDEPGFYFGIGTALNF